MPYQDLRFSSNTYDGFAQRGKLIKSRAHNIECTSDKMYKRGCGVFNPSESI